MKESIRSVGKFLLLSLIFTACSNQSSNQEAIQKAKEKVQKAEPVNKFKGIDFAVNKDIVCGMPLSAGVGDTAHFDSKIYGFCSKECKDSFLLSPEKYIAKK
ncbi:MAG: YHS domain-containing protein [Ginsengibacter sp.]